MNMSTWRTICYSGALVGMSGLALVLPGCGAGGGGGGTGPAEEVKIQAPENAPAGSVGVQEEYKNLSPAGKAK
jgi:hypothetical protein